MPALPALPAFRKPLAATSAALLFCCLAALSLMPGPTARANGAILYTVEDVGFDVETEAYIRPAINGSGQVASFTKPLTGCGRAPRTPMQMPPGPRSRPLGRRGPQTSGSMEVAYTAHHTDASLTTLTDLGTLGGGASEALGINDSGQVTGWAIDGEFRTRAFRYPLSMGMGVGTKQIVMEDLGSLGSGYSEGFAINASGVVVGSSAALEGPLEAFRFVDGAMPEMQGLGTAGLGRVSAAHGINDAGVIVGFAEDAANAFPLPARFQPGGMPAIQFLGTLGGSYGYARAVNNQSPAIIVGYSATELECMAPFTEDLAAALGCFVIDGPANAFRVPTTGGPLQSLGVLPLFVNSYAEDVNDQGIVVGHCDDIPVGPFSGQGPIFIPPVEHAFVWEEGVGMRDLNDLIDPGSGWVLHRATGINNQGQIVGVGTFGGNLRAFRLTPVDSTPPSLSNCSVLPASRNAAGGAFTLSVDATDASGLEQVLASVTLPDMTVDDVLLTQVGMTSTYTGTFNAPPNMTGSDIFYPVTFKATDTADNEAELGCGGFTVLKNANPAVVACDVTPNSRNAGGGEFTVTATITDDIGVTQVKARIEGPNSIPKAVLTLQSGTGTNGVWSGTFTAPPNDTGSPESYYVYVHPKDGFGGSADVFCETVTVAANLAPAIKVCDVAPDALPASGGTFTVSASIVDDVGVTGVEADVSGPNMVGPVTLSLVSGSPTNGTWEGTFNVPANPTGDPQLYEVDLTAEDDLGGSTTVDCETVTVIGAVLDDTPPTIIDCFFDPQYLPNTGGEVLVEANVTDDTAVATVKARIQKPGGGFAEVLMHNKGGTLYRGTYDVPGTGSPVATLLSVEILAEDAAGNDAGGLCGHIRLAGLTEAPPGFVRVTPRVLDFGKVFIGKKPVKNVTITHEGGSAGALFVFKHTFPAAPFALVGGGAGAAGTGPSVSGFNTVASGTTKFMKVRFAPTEVGCFEDSLFLLTNDPTQPLIEVRIKGIGCKKVKKK